jgi:hypothetical protein
VDYWIYERFHARNNLVRGFGKTIKKITHQGKIRWKVYDDMGNPHDIVVPNSYYVLNVKYVYFHLSIGLKNSTIGMAHAASPTKIG